MRTLLFLVGLALLSGCALPLPLSEGVVLAPDGAFGERRRALLPDRSTRMDVGVGTAASFYTPDFADRLSERQGHDLGYGQNGFYQFSAPGPQFAFPVGRRGALAFQVGAGPVGWNANGTVEVTEDVFATASLMPSPLQGEVILQRRLFRGDGSGLSVGLFARSEVQDDWLLEDGETVRVLVGGARLAYRLDLHLLRLQGFTSLGYAPGFDVPVVGVGLVRVL